MALVSEVMDPGEEGDRGEAGVKPVKPAGMANPWVSCGCDKLR